MTQHTAKTQQAGDPAAETSTAGAVPTPGNAVPTAAADLAPDAPKKAKVRPSAPAMPGDEDDPAAKAAAAARAAARAKVKQAKKAEKIRDMDRARLRTALKICGAMIVCLLLPAFVGIVVHDMLHFQKRASVMITVSLYPVFITLFLWLFVRTIFKPVADAGTKATPLPPEASDPGTRDDGSLLM